jgi:UDP-glucuronate 4-epimerase
MVEEGFRVALLDNFNDFYDPRIKRQNVRDLQERGAVRVFEADILNPDALARAFSETEPEVVVHLAAWAGVRPSLQKPHIYTDVNVTGTVNLLEKARHFRVRSFIFGSSSSVYGGNTKVPFSESDSVDRPVSPYAATKKAGELLCHTYSHNYGLNITCLRFFTVYGPRQRPEMAIHKFASLICSGAAVPVFGDGTSRRDYTFVDDIVSGIVAAIRVNHAYEVFNLGESETITLRELISLLERALGRRAQLQFFPEQAGDMKITYADITRAREALGYAPATRIEAGIGKFADWYLKEREMPGGSRRAF